MGNRIMRKVTFMTQVHNGEDFVEETIRSVLNQSDPDFWYFVRLNACTDGSEEIVRRLAAEDDRIVVLKNKKNYWTDDGVSAVKRGYWPSFDSEYVAVLDHDDILHPDFIKELYPKAKQYNADMSIGGNFFFDTQTKKVISERKPPEFAAETLEEFGPYFGECYGCISTYWGKLIKAEIYDAYYETIRIQPKEIALSGDTWAMVDLLHYCQRIVGVSKALLYYRIGRTNNQYSRSKLTDLRIKQGKVLFDAEMKLLEESNGKTQKNIQTLYNVYAGHINELLVLTTNSQDMKPDEKFSYMQKVLKEDLLKTYRDSVLEALDNTIRSCLLAVTTRNEGEPSLWKFYLYRLGRLFLTGIHGPIDLLNYFGIIMAKENELFVGLEEVGRAVEDWVPKREAAFFALPIEKRKFLLKKSLPEALREIMPATEKEKQMEEKMTTAMEKNEWVEAFSFLQQLDRYTLLNENSICCRLIISILQENTEQAVQLACVGYSIFPENKTIKTIYNQIFSDTE